MTDSSWLRSRAWGVVAVVGAIVALATIPYAPNWWLRTILPRLQPHVTLWYVGLGTAILAGLLAWAWSAGLVHRAKAIGVLLAVMAIYVLFLYTVYRHEPPAKKWHLVQYGLMAGVTFQAVRVDVRRRAGLFAGLVFLFLVGTADEVSQNFINMRTFRWLDLFGNYEGIILGLVAWLSASPHSPWRRSEREG
ncbi:MAG: VanZ family protein [Thermoanaerobaculia bacterium]